VQGWYGPIISRYVDAFKNQDGQGYGVTLETAPIHPGLGALSLSWKSGLQHKRTMSQISHLGNIIILTRDYFSGRVDVNKQGNPVVHYNLNQYDAQHMMRGILESSRIHQAAGAIEIGAPFAIPLTWNRDHDDFESYLAEVGSKTLQPNNFALYSAHQMSSCRMSASPRLGAVAPNGETFEVKGLYVADGSVLPTASGVNPMLTIMSTAYLIAGHIKAAHHA
jgi:choline dehydrogenase-like flavoprotein